MAIYDGVLSVGNEEVHVILGVADDHVTMSSSGNEIGVWAAEEVDIEPVGDGVYMITAESESLRFVPNDPHLFGIRFGDDGGPGGDDTSHGAADQPPEASDETSGTLTPPPPRTATRVAFYVLAAITGGLGIWSLVSILVG